MRNKEKNPLVEKYTEQFNELKNKMSAIRKQGYDTKIAEMRAMAIPGRLYLAAMTEDKKDISRIPELLDDLKKEIEGS